LKHAVDKILLLRRGDTDTFKREVEVVRDDSVLKSSVIAHVTCGRSDLHLTIARRTSKE
jgi:hypothetical protein